MKMWLVYHPADEVSYRYDNEQRAREVCDGMFQSGWRRVDLGALVDAATRVVAWKDAIEVLAPELGAASTALFVLRAALAQFEGPVE